LSAAIEWRERANFTTPESDLNEVYARELRNHPEGHALYFKVPGSSMKPGTCGYFNESGHWRTIAQI